MPGATGGWTGMGVSGDGGSTGGNGDTGGDGINVKSRLVHIRNSFESQ